MMCERSITSCLTVVAVIFLSASAVTLSRAAEPPVLLGPMFQNEANPLVLPDGTVYSLYRESSESETFVARASRDNGRTWSEPERVATVPGAAGYGCRTLVDRDGEIHVFFLRDRQQLHIFHFRSTDGRTRWTEPQRMFDQRVGSLRSVIQLEDGRIVFPHQYRVPGRELTHPTGWGVTTVDYSDDGGRTWVNTGAALTAPCDPDYNGVNVGATEPAIIELKDGRLWMLMRTQTGYLYESFSSDRGETWTPAVASRFPSHNGPAALARVPDGRIVLFWNNSAPVSKYDGRGVYGGRDALHAAVSSDDGRTWRGFREVYRDPHRNDIGEPRGDRGTGYPSAAALPDGRVLLFTGQMEGRRAMLLIDPDWLEQTTQRDDFSRGLEAWLAFKNVGPHVRAVFRERVPSARLLVHPDDPTRKAMEIGRPDEHDPDGAAWNFPAGRKGTLTLSIRPGSDFAGLHIGLGDRTLEPCDPATDGRTNFSLPVGKDGRIGERALGADAWSEVELTWDLDAGACQVRVDGQTATKLAMQTPPTNGISYLFLRAAPETRGPAGVLVESVAVEVEP